MTASIWNPGSTNTPSSPESTPHLFTPGTVSAPGLAFVGDVDTGIFQEAAGRVSVGTNGTKRVTVDELGNVLFEGAKVSFGTEAPVTAAATIDLGSYTTNTLVVSGASLVITSFGTNYKGFFCVRFSTSQTIQQGALLQCPGSVDYTVTANTTVFVYPKSGGGWTVAGNISPVAITTVVGLEASGVTAYSTTHNLTSADFGSVIKAVGAITLTLPAAGSGVSGSIICIYASTANVTLAAVGANTIYATGGVALSSITIPFGDSLMLVTTGTDWIQVAGSRSIGAGQTWQALSGSRAFGATYTNTTSRTIAVSVAMVAAVGLNTFITGTVDSVVTGITGSYSPSGSEYFTLNFLVPPGSTYIVSVSGGGTLNAWAELR